MNKFVNNTFSTQNIKIFNFIWKKGLSTNEIFLKFYIKFKIGNFFLNILSYWKVDFSCLLEIYWNFLKITYFRCCYIQIHYQISIRIDPSTFQAENFQKKKVMIKINVIVNSLGGFRLIHNFKRNRKIIK